MGNYGNINNSCCNFFLNKKNYYFNKKLWVAWVEMHLICSEIGYAFLLIFLLHWKIKSSIGTSTWPTTGYGFYWLMPWWHSFCTDNDYMGNIGEPWEVVSWIILWAMGLTLSAQSWQNDIYIKSLLLLWNVILHVLWLFSVNTIL